MGILSKSSVGFRISPLFLIKRGWGTDKDHSVYGDSSKTNESLPLEGLIHFDKEHFLRYRRDSLGNFVFTLHGKDITKIEQILLLERMWTAKTQKQKVKLRRKLFGKREKSNEEYMWFFDPSNLEFHQK